MNRIGKFLVATLLSAAVFLTCAANAMEIQKFVKMSEADQKTYFNLLLTGAEQVLQQQGRTTDVAKIEHIFSTTLPGDRDVMGVVEFERNLAIMREDDAKNAVSHPKDPRLEVEDVMVATLHMNGIELPDNFYQLASLKNFKPKLPPQNQKK